MCPGVKLLTHASSESASAAVAGTPAIAARVVVVLLTASGRCCLTVTLVPVWFGIAVLPVVVRLLDGHDLVGVCRMAFDIDLVV